MQKSYLELLKEGCPCVLTIPRGEFTYQTLKAIGKQLNINYKVDPRYLANPLDHLYQNHDVEISNRPEILEIQDFAIDLSDKIEGDFHLEFLTLQIRHNQLAFVHTGLIAAQIKFKKLYKRTHRNFDHYCREELGVSYCSPVKVA